jgi:hypothetical protein
MIEQLKEILAWMEEAWSRDPKSSCWMVHEPEEIGNLRRIIAHLESQDD